MIDDNYLVLFTSLCCPHVAGFHLRENAVGNYNYSQDRSFLKGNEEKPALVLPNVHNRTSARDGPMFGSKGPSMNTSSLFEVSYPRKHSMPLQVAEIAKKTYTRRTLFSDLTISFSSSVFSCWIVFRSFLKIFFSLLCFKLFLDKSSLFQQ